MHLFYYIYFSFSSKSKFYQHIPTLLQRASELPLLTLEIFIKSIFFFVKKGKLESLNIKYF